MNRPTKRCRNIECEKTINVYKSNKRKFCSDQCRNRHGFLLRKVKNKEMNLYFKNLKDLEKLLSHLLKYDIDRISREDIENSLFKNLKLPSLDSKLIEGKLETGIVIGTIFIESLKFVNQDWYCFRKI